YNGGMVEQEDSPLVICDLGRAVCIGHVTTTEPSKDPAPPANIGATANNRVLERHEPGI
ncbi:hypothetical protein AaE_001687, partial [Aphanomyces astaci]